MYKQAKCLIYNINIFEHRTVGYMTVNSRDWQEKAIIASNIPYNVQKTQKESGQNTQKQLKSCPKQARISIKTTT